MQRLGKSPANWMEEDYTRFLSMFGSLQLENPKGTQLGFPGDTSCSNYPANSVYDPYQPPPQRNQPPLPYTSVPNNRGLYPFTSPPPPPPTPTPTYSTANYTRAPQPSYDLPYQPSHVRAQETIFDIITRSDGGNRLIRIVQQLIRSGSIESLIQIILMLSSDPYSLYLSACSKNGSWTLQKFISTIKSSRILISHNLTKALSLGFPHIACDVMGRHVIRECFKALSYVENEVLSVKMQDHCIRMATDRVGCILLNECIPLMESTYKDGILENIVIYCQRLAHDRYGTYVVQNAVIRKHRYFTPLIVHRLRGMIKSLSVQKEGSHLVEKCLECSSTKHIVMEELVKLSRVELRSLACHEFGNFVIQKALSSMPDEDSPKVRELTLVLRRGLDPALRYLQLDPIGRNVYKKWKLGNNVWGRAVPSTSSGVFNVHDPLDSID